MIIIQVLMVLALLIAQFNFFKNYRLKLHLGEALIIYTVPLIAYMSKFVYE
jgi:hypothetical protein